jgi:hypothetical protein
MRQSLALTLLAALLALSSCAVQATFIESFALPPPNAPSTTPKNQLPYLWQQSALIKQGGRGASGTTGSLMVLQDDKPTAETAMLKWDKTTPAEHVFYAAKEDYWADGHEDCSGVVRLLFSEDGINWSKQWEQDIKEWDPKGFEPVSVTLPLVEGSGKFAVKWVYTQPKTYQTCYMISLDDITFPAEAPGPAGKPASSPQPPKPKPVMRPGVAPPPFPATFAGTCTWAATYCGGATAHNTTNSTGRGVNARVPARGAGSNTTVPSSTQAITFNASTSNTTDTTDESTVEEATATIAGNDTASPAPADPTADDPAANTVVDTTTAPASRHGGNAAAQSLPGRKLKQFVLEANGL